MSDKDEISMLSSKTSFSIEDLLDIIRILRSENGCPWDREQTHKTIRKNFIEETYEVCEAIDCEDASLLKEELGDVLLQIVLHSRMEEEENSFSFSDVVTDICKKLIIRHPHVFSTTEVSGVEDVLNNWAEIKQASKKQKLASETLEAVPRQLPALMRAQKIQDRAKKANDFFGNTSLNDALTHLKEELDEFEDELDAQNCGNIADELGDILFAAVNISRHLKLDSEELLTSSTDKFIKRFIACEKLAAEDGIDFETADKDTLDTLWVKVKEACIKV